MKGKSVYRISKVDTRIYVQGFSGILVYKAVYAIIIALGVFVGLYLLTSPFLALLIVVPLLMLVLYRLKRIQQTLGPGGYRKQQVAKQLPQFISVKHPLKHFVNP